MPAHFNQLLMCLYLVGHEMQTSGSALRRQWGKHLLEDWRSLELLAQKLADEPPPAEPPSRVKGEVSPAGTRWAT